MADASTADTAGDREQHRGDAAAQQQPVDDASARVTTSSHDAAVGQGQSSPSRATSSPPTTTTMAIPSTAAQPLTARDGDDAASTYEQQHVHAVYETIAPHFSATRHKPWPVVSGFLRGLPPGSVGLDVGCGNGKYLGENPLVHVVGSDRSASLVRIARDHGGGADVAVADGLALPFRARAADFAICIAVIHHMSTRERRVEAARALLDCVRDGGQVLVFVWALEQKSSRRGWDEGGDQDLLVPWVLKSKQQQKKKKKGEEGSGGEDPVYQRYYHLYKKGELEEDVVAAGGKVIEAGYDRDNWWAIGTRESSPTSS